MLSIYKMIRTSVYRKAYSVDDKHFWCLPIKIFFHFMAMFAHLSTFSIRMNTDTSCYFKNILVVSVYRLQVIFSLRTRDKRL